MKMQVDTLRSSNAIASETSVRGILLLKSVESESVDVH